jgi:FkbM family methyltransferase
VAVTPAHDPVFQHFPPFVGDVATDFLVDFLGCRIRESIMPSEFAKHRVTLTVQTSWPAFDEEYYEFVDLLEAVLAADESFTMLEFGAGFARWAVYGALAARSRGMKHIRLGVVEPEPMHLDFMRTFLADNGIPEEIVDVYPGTISEEAGKTLFLVKKHVSITTDHPREWYGQAKAPGSWRPTGVLSNGYFGRDLLVYPNGEGAIEVEQFASGKLLKKYPKIDLIDLDVQGEEFAVLYGAIDVLNKNTKRLHVGTHGTEIEANLREMLTANRWTCLRDYECGKVCKTPVGEIEFQDGIQSWINPRLADA